MRIIIILLFIITFIGCIGEGHHNPDKVQCWVVPDSSYVKGHLVANESGVLTIHRYLKPQDTMPAIVYSCTNCTVSLTDIHNCK